LSDDNTHLKLFFSNPSRKPPIPQNKSMNL